MYSLKDSGSGRSPVSVDFIRSVINRFPIAKSRRAVFPGEATGKADVGSPGIVVVDWVDMLPAEALDDIFQKGLQWEEIHGVLNKGGSEVKRS